MDFNKKAENAPDSGPFCGNLLRSQAMPLTMAKLRRLLIKMFVAIGRFRVARSRHCFNLVG